MLAAIIIVYINISVFTVWENIPLVNNFRIHFLWPMIIVSSVFLFDQHFFLHHYTPSCGHYYNVHESGCKYYFLRVFCGCWSLHNCVMTVAWMSPCCATWWPTCCLECNSIRWCHLMVCDNMIVSCFVSLSN